MVDNAEMYVCTVYSVRDYRCIIILFFFFISCFFFFFCLFLFFFQAEDGIRDLVRSRGLGDVYKRQVG